ncbi:peptidyl-prolyl cis-trans isomerase [Candidatus Woesearchaeota archaeon]|nr:peptidyl-prolyl cis-trans isomerase [Candidatus Woesearchaeota archaeon]
MKEVESENPIVVMETSMGTMEIELYQDKAPLSVENFLAYVNEGYYDGLIFHRIIEGFMVQGGGFDQEMKQKATKDPIKNEAGNGLTNDKYTLAMARTNVVDSATSQFFINVEFNTFLNHRDESAQGFGYAVFGKVIKGMDVADKIKRVPTGNSNGFQDVPIENVIIEKISLKS